MEKSLEDYFKESESSYKFKKVKVKSEKKGSISRNKEDSKFMEFFKNRFSFDHNVNLTDQTNVLYRRNYCIKNILALLNLILIIFSFVGITKSNYILTIVFSLLVFGLSQTKNYMLRRKKDDYNHQQIIMYVQCFFGLILSVILYVKVFLGFTLVNEENTLTNAQFAVTQAAYILIYVSILVISLYQDLALLRQMFFWSFLIIVCINLTLVHPELYSHASSIKELFNYVIKDNKVIFQDIILRTLVFFVFYATIYSQSSITSYMFEERKIEHTRRVGVETNFTDVVESVFEAVKVYNLSEDIFKERIASRRVMAVSKELSKALNLDLSTVNKIQEYAVIHSERINELSLNDYDRFKESDFDSILVKTRLATTIIKRLQLKKKSEDMVQGIFGNEIDSTFITKMTVPADDIESGIIMVSEIYDILRNDRPYKKALNHVRATELIVNNFSQFLSSDIILRFSKFNNEIKEAYDKA